MKSLVVSVVAIVLSNACATPSFAYWDVGGVQLWETAFRPNAVSDGTAGVVAVWADDEGAEPGVYAHRIDAEGEPVWLAPVRLSESLSKNVTPQIARTSSGFIVAWLEPSQANDVLRLAMVESDGDIEDEREIDAIETDANDLKMLASDYGGAVITWTADNDTHWLRVNADLTTAMSRTWDFDDSQPILVNDSAEGDIIVVRSFAYPTPNIRALRIGETDETWGDDFVVAIHKQFPASIDLSGACPDGNGGVVILSAFSSGSANTILAQYLDSDGDTQWNGIYYPAEVGIEFASGGTKAQAALANSSSRAPGASTSNSTVKIARHG